MHKPLLAGLLTAVLAPGLVLSASTISHANAPKLATAKPYLGVMIGPMEKGDQPGAIVRKVTPDSPAAKAGMKQGDIVLQVDGREVKNTDALAGMVAGHKPGDSLKLHVRRDGKEQDMNVVLAERPAPRLPKLDFPQEKAGAFLGVWTRPMTPELKDKLGVAADKGAVVLHVMPESPAAKAGIVRNDVITAVNDQVVDTPEELRAAVRKAGAGKEAMVKFLHGNEAKEAKVKLDESSLSFGRMGDIQERFPKMFEQLKGELPPGLSLELRQQIEELHQRFRDMQEKAK